MPTANENKRILHRARGSLFYSRADTTGRCLGNLDPTASSISIFLRERQRRALGGFRSRELQQAFGRSPHVLRRLELSAELVGHRGCVNTVTCTPDGRYWITGSDDMKLMV